jgi:hypothetical protein
MPLSDDVIKCQRKPVSAVDYPAGLTGAHLAQLRAIYSTGVCDFSKPAAEDVERSMVWTSVGGETLEAPHELHWRVARSSATPTAADSVGSAGGGRLPATGSASTAVPALLLIAAVVLLRRLRTS